MGFQWFPGLKRLCHYKLSFLPKDITSGMIVAFLLIPQSMAYAVIAGVPVVYGLVAAIFPLAIYTIVGGSRYLSVGPVSISSLLAFSSAALMVQTHPYAFLTLMIMLTLVVGVLQLLLALIKFGTFFDAISPAVIHGFTSASAIIIGLTQVKSLLGLKLDAPQDILQYIHSMFLQITETHIWTMTIGIGSLLILVLAKRFIRLSIGPLIAIAGSCITVGLLNLDQRGVDIIGHIPQNLPAFSLLIPDASTLLSLLPSALTIAFISYAESYAVSSTLASFDNEKLNPNQELFGLGLANITSSITGAIPVAGAMSRSAVNYQAGAKTNLSSIISVICVWITLAFFTPFLYYLPQAALAAIIIMAISKLINVSAFRYYIKHQPSSALLMLITFTMTLFSDIFIGLITGVFLSLILTFLKSRIQYLSSNH